jgi:hypothetical protein
MTDEGGAAKKVGSESILNGSVNHSMGEYVRGEIRASSSDQRRATPDGFFLSLVISLPSFIKFVFKLPEFTLGISLFIF